MRIGPLYLAEDITILFAWTVNKEVGKMDGWLRYTFTGLVIRSTMLGVVRSHQRHNGTTNS